MRKLLAIILLTFGVELAAAEPQDTGLRVVIAKADGTHVESPFPKSESEWKGVRHIWAWTSSSPPLRFDLTEGRVQLTKVLDELSRPGARSVEVRLQGWSRPEETELLRVFAAPREMWESVPEALLPSFDVARDGLVRIPVRGSIRFRAAGDGWGTGWLTTGAKTSLNVQLQPAKNAILTLQSKEEFPVSRAFITATVTPAGASRPILQAQFATDEHEKLQIPALPEAGIVALLIISPGFAPVSISGTPSELSRTLTLEPAGRLRGRFVDEDGEPISGVQVEAEGWIASDIPALSGQHTLSDDGGYWTLNDLPRGRAMIRAMRKGRATFHKEVSLEMGEVDLGPVTLLPSRDVVLEVLDMDNRPIPKATVTSGLGFRGETDDKGIVILSGIGPADATSVTLSAKGFARRTIYLRPPVPGRERVNLERSFSVAGRMAGESGAPLGRPSIVVRSGSSYWQPAVASDGTFSFEVDAGRDFELTFESSSTASITHKEAAGRAGESRNLGTVLLPAGRLVRGRILDAEGIPVEGSRVWAIRPSTAGTVASWVAGRTLEGTSDAEGKFEVRGLPIGLAILRMDASGFARAHLRIEVGEEPVDAGDVELLRGSTVIVNIEDEEAGTARLDLRGDWIDADMITAPVVSGIANLRHVPPGAYRVTVTGPNAVLCEERVEVEKDSEPTVDCPSRTVVHGRALLDGKPAYGGLLTWSRTAETDALINTNISPLGARRERVFGLGEGTIAVPVRVDGTFETDRLRPGNWQVAWRSSEGIGTPDRSFAIPRAAASPIIVEFAGGVIRGRVVDATNQAVAGARVREIAGPLFTISSANGDFTMAAVEPGVHRLQASHGKEASPVVDVTVEPGKQIPPVILEIDEVERNVLTVHVEDSRRSPVPHATVFVETQAGVRILTADPQGIARATFPEGLRDSTRLIAFANNEWAFSRLRIGEQAASHSATIRFSATGALLIRSAKVAGDLTVLSPHAGNLSWMLGRVGSILDLTADSALTIRGLPAGDYELRLDTVGAIATVRAGATTSVDLP